MFPANSFSPVAAIGAADSAVAGGGSHIVNDVDAVAGSLGILQDIVGGPACISVPDINVYERVARAVIAACTAAAVSVVLRIGAITHLQPDCEYSLF